MKRWFLLRKGKSKIFFSLDIRAWSTETQANIALLSYSGAITHSALLVFLYTHWKYLKPHFLMFPGGIERDWWHEVGLRNLKSTHSQMFFRIGVLKNFAKFKGKQLSRSLFLIKLQASRLATLLKKELQLRCFPLNTAKFLGTALLIEHFRWLLLDPVTH